MLDLKIDKEWLLLDHAASTLAFEEVKNTALDFLSNYGSIHRGQGKPSQISTDLYEKARCELSDLFNGMEIVFCSNTTDALNKISLILDKTHIGTTSIEHSANLLCWLKYHLSLSFIEINDLDELTPEYLNHWLQENKQIKVFTVASASNLTGTHLRNIKEIYDVCQKNDVILILDSCQYVPHLAAKNLIADFIVFSGHKCYAPFGGGAIVAKKDLLYNTKRSLTGGGNIVYIDENNNLTYKNPPHNHEIGTPNAVGAITMVKAMKMVNDDINSNDSKIVKHESEILEKFKIIQNYLLDKNWVVVGAKDTPIISIGNFDVKKTINLSKIFFQHKIAHRLDNFCVHRAVRRLVKASSPEETVMLRLSGGLGTDIGKMERFADFFQFIVR